MKAMNFLRKTLVRTSKSSILLPPLPFPHYPFSLSSPYSTKLPYDQPEVEVLFPMEEDINRISSERREKKNLGRPSEIAFQPKVANWLNLVGTVKLPVQFRAAVDGKLWAGTIISQQGLLDLPSPLPWVPVIFEGDLAVTALAHVKENDVVHVAGHLSPDPLPINLTNDQVTVQVIAQDLSFVHTIPGAMKKVSRS